MSAPHLILLLIVPAVVAVASLALLVYAVHGRRVDDHPVCRTCGFDLIGKPQGATVCSECGADLARARAVRFGRRQTRRQLVAISVSVLLACAGWLGMLGWRATRGIVWNHHKPLWLLTREARGGHVIARDAALTELTRRMGGGKLSQQQTDALVDAALEIQADSRRPWTATVADVFTRTRAAGKLSDPRWRRYAGQAAALELRARATVRRGDPLVYSPTITSPRLAPGHTFFLDYEIVDTQFGGVPVGTHLGVRHGGTILRAGEPFTGPVFLPPMDDASLASLADGTQMLRLAVRVTVREFTGRGLQPAGELLVDERRVLAAPVALAPANAATVKLKRDESLRPAVERSLEATYMHANGRNSKKPGVLVDCSEPPVNLAYQVLLRSRDGSEWELGEVQFEGAPPNGSAPPREIMDLSRPIAELYDGPHPRVRADLILRPSVDAAVRTLRMTEIWAGEVVFKNLDLPSPSLTFDLWAAYRAGTGPASQPAAPNHSDEARK